VSALKVGVIGAGAWGRNHVRTLASLPGAQLVAVCDAAAKTREKLGSQYPAVTVTDDPKKLFGMVEAVVVATPANTHADLARQAIAAGVPVLVEKPFALSVKDAEDVAERAAKAKVPVMAGHLLEYHPVVERLKEMISAGTLGQIYYLYGQRVNLGQVRPDENALWSFGPHDVSVALFLMGAAPVTVTAVGKSYLQPGIEDVVFVTMEFASGVLAHVQLSWLDPHKERRITVVGSKQMAVFDDMASREKLRVYDKGVSRPDYASYGESLQIRDGDISIPRLSNAEPLVQELAHFLKVARREIPARSDAADGVRVVRVLAAASESLKQSGKPVQVKA
jgi:predicted dehydrogenase